MDTRKVRSIEVQDVVGVSSTIRAVMGPIVVGQPSEEVPDDRHDRAAWWLVQKAFWHGVWEVISNLPFLRKRMAEKMGRRQRRGPGRHPWPPALTKIRRVFFPP